MRSFRLCLVSSDNRTHKVFPISAHAFCEWDLRSVDVSTFRTPSVILCLSSLLKDGPMKHTSERFTVWAFLLAFHCRDLTRIGGLFFLLTVFPFQLNAQEVSQSQPAIIFAADLLR